MGLGEGKRAQEDAPDDGKHRGVGAGAKRQERDGNEGKRRAT